MQTLRPKGKSFTGLWAPAVSRTPSSSREESARKATPLPSAERSGGRTPRGRRTRRLVLTCIKGTVARGALTMPPRTEEQLRRRAKNARRRYTSKRMSSLKQRFPLIPPDVLERATLRQVSTAVRKIGYGQNALSAFSAGECSSGLLSNILPEESQA